MSDNPILKTAAEVIETYQRSHNANEHIGLVQRYLRGDHNLPYMPKGAKKEYHYLAEISITNWLPLISDTFAKRLFVDGYSSATGDDNSEAWTLWQANGLDARQGIVHRGALEYGAAYVMVLPGEPDPVIRPLPATKSMAWFDDDEDLWPVLALRDVGLRMDGSRAYQLFQGDSIYTVLNAGPDQDVLWDKVDAPNDVFRYDTGKLVLESVQRHGLPYVPWVRFRDRLDGENRGVIRPVLPIQDRINNTVFSIAIVMQFQAFKQRWATGLAIPIDEDETLPDGSPNPNYGKPVQAFEAAVNRLWVSDNPEAKFGEFGASDIRPHIEEYKSEVRTLSAISQVSPLVMMGDLVNLAADALSSVEQTTTRKGEEYETIFGESWEQVLNTASLLAGIPIDESAQVRWRDTEARSLAATTDALIKQAQGLMVPYEALWEKIPGVTQQDVARWKEMIKADDGIAALMADIERQRAELAEPAQAEDTGNESGEQEAA